MTKNGLAGGKRVSDVSQGQGWWQASDGKWYAPELHRDNATADAFTQGPNADPVFGAPNADPVFGAPNAAPIVGEAIAPFNPGPNADPVFGAPNADPVFGAPQSLVDNSQAYAPIDLPSAGNYPTAASTIGQKSKIAAGLLGIFLGWLGIHRFYLGYKKLGITMLLLTVLTVGALLPIIAIWGIVEGVLILMGKIHRDAYGSDLSG